MDTTSPEANAVLARLTNELKGKTPFDPIWLAVGDALSDLERLQKTQDQGKRWVEILAAYLLDLDKSYPATIGHLNKVRRVHRLIRDAAGDVPDETIRSTQFSALELAERLHGLNAEKGLAALRDCLNGKLHFSDMRRQYDKFLQDNIDALPAKQTTWLNKQTKPKDVQRAQVFAALTDVDFRFFCKLWNMEISNRTSFNPSELRLPLSDVQIGYRFMDPAYDTSFAGIMLHLGKPTHGRNIDALIDRILVCMTFFHRLYVAVDHKFDALQILDFRLADLDVRGVGFLVVDLGADVALQVEMRINQPAVPVRVSVLDRHFAEMRESLRRKTGARAW